MPRTIRFHLDESADPRIASGLRLHGVDITTSAETHLLGASDEQQLQHAVNESKVIITQDADFLRMAATGCKHCGIAFFPAQVRSIGDIIRDALLIWEVYEPEDMKDRIEFF